MAVTQNTLIGRTRGRLGAVTFSTWKGQNVVRTLPVSPFIPDTPAQRAQQDVIRNATKFYQSQSTQFIDVLSQNRMEVNNFQYYMRKNSQLFTSANGIIDPYKAKNFYLGNGDLLQPTSSVSFFPHNPYLQVDINLNINPKYIGLAGEVAVLIYNGQQNNITRYSIELSEVPGAYNFMLPSYDYPFLWCWVIARLSTGKVLSKQFNYSFYF